MAVRKYGKVVLKMRSVLALLVKADSTGCWQLTLMYHISSKPVK